MSLDTTEVVISSKEDAHKVLDTMKDLLKAYEIVTVADFLQLCGISSTYSDNKIGWVDLINIKVKPVNGGFILDLPAAKPV